jgi:hypothetical protein
MASLLGAFAVSALLLPKAYESTATLLPQLDSKEGGSLAALLATTGAGGMAQNLGVGLPSMPTTPTDVFVAILKSRVMADEAIAKFGLMAVYNERTMHDTRVELAERVSGQRLQRKSHQGDGGRCGSPAGCRYRSLFREQSGSPEPHIECQQGRAIIARSSSGVLRRRKRDW